MKKHNEKKEHPEITNIDNICDIVPDAGDTKEICDKIKQQEAPKIKSNHALKQTK